MCAVVPGSVRHFVHFFGGEVHETVFSGHMLGLAKSCCATMQLCIWEPETAANARAQWAGALAEGSMSSSILVR